MRIAITNGLTVDEVGEAIAHLTFYTGWPSAMTAVTIANELVGDTPVA
jgi:4-carboxymuconolactone decarboxylase